MTILQIDARGISCPEPLILAKKAMSQAPAGFQIIVDNNAAKENVSRFAQGKGYSVQSEQRGNDIIISISRIDK